MSETIAGVHHVTAIAGDPQRNLDFYTGVLGLRLVKRTVNFDDPGTYHFYYGDDRGRPGTLLTFFPWPSAPEGRRGGGQVAVTSFSVPWDALDYWSERLASREIVHEGPVPRFDERVVSFADPDGLRLEIVAHPGADREPGPSHGPVPPEVAIRGLRSVTLVIGAPEKTTSLLTGVMGFQAVGTEGNRSRYRATADGPAALVDVIAAPGSPRGRDGVGTVHHVAWRVPSDEAERAWRERIEKHGLHPTPVLDRQYFRSIYFREPGGVLFEIATDPPGFAVDESLDDLGGRLMLPPWLESLRPRIEESLPRVRVPKMEKVP